jgi:hypothetical protein
VAGEGGEAFCGSAWDISRSVAAGLAAELLKGPLADGAMARLAQPPNTASPAASTSAVLGSETMPPFLVIVAC